MDTVFDTLAYTRRLKAAGIDDAHAEALADALCVAFSEGVATKADIGRLEAKMDSWIASMRWTLAFLGALILAMAGRLFGAF